MADIKDENGEIITDEAGAAITDEDITHTLTAEVGTCSVSGKDASLLENLVLSAADGEVIISKFIYMLDEADEIVTDEAGNPILDEGSTGASLYWLRVIPATVETINVTGYAVDLGGGLIRYLSASAGSMSIGVETAGLLKNSLLSGGIGKMFINTIPIFDTSGDAIADTSGEAISVPGTAALIYISVSSLSANKMSVNISGKSALTVHSRLLTAASRSVSTSGFSAMVIKQKLLSGEAGSVTVGPQDSAFYWHRMLEGAVGAFAITGQAADEIKQLLLSGTAGAILITGQDAVMGVAGLPVIFADVMPMLLGGQAASLLKHGLLTAANDQLDISGQDASVLRMKLLAAAAGTESINGQDASLLFQRILDGECGQLDLTFYPTAGAKAYTMSAGSGQFNIVGENVGLYENLVITGLVGQWTLTGNDANVRLAGRLWGTPDDRTIIVEYENRLIVIEYENRLMAVGE